MIRKKEIMRPLEDSLASLLTDFGRYLLDTNGKIGANQAFSDLNDLLGIVRDFNSLMEYIPELYEIMDSQASLDEVEVDY